MSRREVQHLSLRRYKEGMITLLAKVVRVSVDTVKITEEMKTAERERP